MGSGSVGHRHSETMSVTSGREGGKEVGSDRESGVRVRVEGSVSFMRCFCVV